MKKHISVLLVSMLLLSSFAGCSGTAPTDSNTEDAGSNASTESSTRSGEITVSEPGQFPIVSDPITLTAYAVQTVQVEDLKTNDATKALEEKTNVKLELEVVMEAAADEKRNLLLASGDYPDIFLTGRFTSSDITSYGIKQNILIPLNDLIDKYAVEVKQTETSIPNFLKDIQAVDGNIYALPAINDCYHCSYQAKLWMNTQWLDNLGLAVPTTTEEFRQTLIAFRDNDPNGNGQKDEIPLSGHKTDAGQLASHMFQYLMSSFIQFDGKCYFISDNNTLKYIADTEQWREGLAYMNSLYMDGLIDPTAFTQEKDQLRQLSNQDEIIIGSVPTLHPRTFINMDTDDGERHKIYNAIPPLEGPNGQREASLGVIKRGAEGGFAITDKCEFPEVAIRVLDYIYSEEGTLLFENGLEGDGWQKAPEGLLNLKGEQADYESIGDWTGSGTVQNNHWHQMAPTKRTTEYRNKIATAQDIYSADGYERRLYLETFEKYEPYKSKSVIGYMPKFTPEQNDIIAQYGIPLETYVQQSMVRFVTGDLNIEKDWESYTKGLEDLNLAQYISVHADGYGIPAAK